MYVSTLFSVSAASAVTAAATAEEHRPPAQISWWLPESSMIEQEKVKRAAAVCNGRAIGSDRRAVPTCSVSLTTASSDSAVQEVRYRVIAPGHVVKCIALEGQPFRQDVRQRIEPELAADLLASRAGSVTLIPRPPSGRGKVLQVADGRPGKSSTAYSPDENNVYNGDYPLQVPLVLYVRQDRLTELAPALRWLFSDEAAALLEKQGLSPAPKAVRARFVQRLDTR